MKLKNQIQNRRIMLVIVVSFLVYNILVYTHGTTNNTPIMSKLALKGEKIFQEYNCSACHQLYGLGGYLGPDLTNVISKPGKGPLYVEAFLNSGVKAMPKFNFTKLEKKAIVQFLTEVDNTGYYPCFNAEKQNSGWVEINYKNK